MDKDEMIEKILAQEKKDMDKMSKADVLGMWADYTDPDDDEYDMVEAMTAPQIVEAYLFAYRQGLEGNDEEELEDRIFNWESYDKPKYNRMMADGFEGEGAGCGCTTAFASPEGGCGCPTTKNVDARPLRKPKNP